MNNNRDKKIFITEIIIIVCIIIGIFAYNFLGTKKVSVKSSDISKLTLEDLKKDNLVIGVLMGSTAVEARLKEKYKNVECKYYNTNDDVYTAVESGVIKYGMSYGASARKVAKENKHTTYIEEPLSSADFCFVFPKTDNGKDFLYKYNSYVEKIKESGYYDKMEQKWLSMDSKNYHLNEYKFSGENGELNICTCGTWEPYSFYYNGEIVGFMVDLIESFCAEYGYIPNIETATFSAELAGISSGKYDIMADVAERTEEREKVVYMSTPILVETNIVLVHEDEFDTVDVKKSEVFFTDLKNSFYKNFVTDNRWIMLVSGLLVTIAMSIFSAIFGTILGGIICFLRMSKNTLCTSIARLYVKIIQGTPIVVLLMILNYIIFVNMKMTAFTVSVIGFSIDFAAYVSEIFRFGIEAVPSGQEKAALALGFNKKQVFTKVVFPQALIHIIPVYSGQFISMVKLTSVAGYIAVQDLTKVSDYIRSLTYEAFFPLISTAIIYFILSSWLVSLLKVIEKKIDPKLRKIVIEGVKL